MKTLIMTLGLAASFALAPFAGQARAQDNSAPAPSQAMAQGNGAVSFQTFYDQLASQGTWVNSDKYGYVFQPTENDPNWRPYTYGHWVNTDAGMTWVSDDSFGWATDHYGRWVNLDNVGWAWVPGYTWAPAWVSWREGGDAVADVSDDASDEVGWAPLPPDSDVGIDYYGNNDFGDFGLGFGFHIGDDCDTAYGIGPGCYNFCPVAYIGDRDAWRHFRDRRDNFALIGHTRNVTNINFRRAGADRFGHVRESGLDVARLNERAHTRIATAQLASVSGRNDAGLHGNTLGVFAPRVDRNTVRSARPAEVTRSVANVGVNRGTDINRPLAVNSRVAPVAATPEQIRAARTAETHDPASARIATANTRISHPLTQPLTSMKTDTRTATSSANAQRFNSSTSAATQAPRASTGDARFTGEPATTAPRADSAPATGSNFAGQTAQRQAMMSQRNPAFTGESRFTGEPSNKRANGEPRTTHQAQVISPVHSEPLVRNSAPTFATGEANRPASIYHSSAEPVYRPQASAPTFHPSAPVYRPQVSTPVFHPSAPAYHPQAGAPAFHQSAPAYHPQASFHPSASAAHVGGGGGGFHGGAAPAAHAGGGGGAAHVSAGAGSGHR